MLVALPLLAWGTRVDGNALGMHAWAWLDVLWRLGTFALLAGLGGLLAAGLRARAAPGPGASYPGLP